MFQVYVRNSNEALELYRKAFDAKILCNHLHDNGTIAHAEIDIYGQAFAICETDNDEVLTGTTMQFCLHFGEGNEEAVRKAYEVLKEECLTLTAPITGPGECPWSPCLFGLIDKFGVNWCIFV